MLITETNTQRAKAIQQQGYRCCYCREKLHFRTRHTDRTNAFYSKHKRSVTKDHVISRYSGGGNKDNIVYCCSFCNKLKGHMPLWLFLIYLASFEETMVKRLIKYIKLRVRLCKLL